MTGAEFTLQSGSTLVNEIDAAGNTDLIVATTSFTLESGVELDVIVDPSTPQGVDYIIVQGGAISGTFSTVVLNLPRLTSTVTYLSDRILYSFGGSGPTPPTPPVPPQPSFVEILVDAGLACGNAFQVARYLDCLEDNGLVGSGDLESVIDVIDLGTLSEIVADLGQLQPAPYDAMVIAQQYSSLDYVDTLVDRLDQVRTLSCVGDVECGWHGWVTPFGSLANQDCLCDQLGYRALEKGISLGFDGRGSHFIMGASLGYTSTSLDWSCNCMGAGLYSYHGALYARLYFQHLYLDVGLGGATDRYHGNRSIHIANAVQSIDRHACSTVQGGELDLHLGAGLNTTNLPFDLTLVGSFDWIHMHRGAFQERGAGSLDLVVQRGSYDFMRYELGLWASKCIRSWVPQIGFAVAYDKRSDRPLEAGFADECGGGCSMSVQGLAPNRVLLIPRAKITQILSDRFTLALSYEGDFAGDYTENSLWLNLGCDF